MSDGGRPDDPRGASRRLLAAMLSWVTLLLAIVWVLIALRLTREDAAGIEHPGMPVALIQFAIAFLGALGAGLGASRAGWYLRTGQEGQEAFSSVAGAVVLFGAWAVIVIPDW